MLGSCDFYGLVVVVFVTLYWKSYRLEFNFIIMVQNICWYANFWLMQFGYRSQDRLIWIYILISLYGRYLVIVSSNTIDTANMCRLLQPIHFLSYPLYFFFPSSSPLCDCHMSSSIGVGLGSVLEGQVSRMLRGAQVSGGLGRGIVLGSCFGRGLKPFFSFGWIQNLDPL